MFGLFGKKPADMARVKAEAAVLVRRSDKSARKPRKDNETYWNDLKTTLAKRPLTDEERTLVAFEAVKEWVRAAKLSDAQELSLDFDTYNLLDLPKSLAKLVHLRSLILKGTGVRSLNHLGGLPRLEKLDVSYCRNLTDISPLMGMRGLSELDLSRSRVTNIRPLETLTGLTSLKLDKCDVSDVSAISGLTKLEHLDLSNSRVTDLSPLAELPNLKSLGLWNVEATDFTALAGLTQLETLDLWNTRIADLSPLADMQRLRHLDLSHTDVTDLTPIDSLPELKTLVLWNTGLQSQSRGVGPYYGRWFDSAIHGDVTKGNLRAVKDRVARGAMIGEDQWSGPIHSAVKSGHLKICQFFVSVDKEMVNDVAFYDGVYPRDTPLSHAIKSRQTAIIAFLLENGARLLDDPQVWNEPWLEGLHLGSAAQVNDITTLQHLLDGGAKHDALDERKLTALHWAVARNNKEAACLLFNLWRADQGQPPLERGDITEALLMEAALRTGATEDKLSYARNLSL